MQQCLRVGRRKELKRGSQEEKGRETRMQNTVRGRILFSFKRGVLSLMTVIIYYGNVRYV